MIWLVEWEKNNRAARAARTLVHLFDAVYQTPTWKFQIYGLNETGVQSVNFYVITQQIWTVILNVIIEQWIFHPLHLLQTRPQPSHLQHTLWTIQKYEHEGNTRKMHGHVCAKTSFITDPFKETLWYLLQKRLNVFWTCVQENHVHIVIRYLLQCLLHCRRFRRNLKKMNRELETLGDGMKVTSFM